ncbi:unnamed protein product [Linum tenue]|uniref:Uncharacterized protein n=1 Tax=Linum tenue TaxID=586396 RepID=A0AAV0I079_9ROSI|nr:unnamed protein product [Linum tenue]
MFLIWLLSSWDLRRFQSSSLKSANERLCSSSIRRLVVKLCQCQMTMRTRSLALCFEHLRRIQL